MKVCCLWCYVCGCEGTNVHMCGMYVVFICEDIYKRVVCVCIYIMYVGYTIFYTCEWCTDVYRCDMLWIKYLCLH